MHSIAFMRDICCCRYADTVRIHDVIVVNTNTIHNIFTLRTAINTVTNTPNAAKQGEIEVAIGHFRQAVAVKPLLPRAWFTLGAALMRLEQWDAALQAYTRVVQQCPDDGEAWGNCGAIHLRAGNWEQAQAALAQALKQNRASWRMWDNQVSCV
jgi:tetratricopeptide (TPR) repeat protein